MKRLLLLAATICCFTNIINAQAGHLDPSFGTHGVVKTDLGKDYNYGASLASKLLLQPDGSVYVVQGLNVVNGEAFNFGNSISKILPDGSADVSFGVKGSIKGANYQINTAAIQSDGKIVAAGDAIVNGTSNFAVVRYNTDGSPDSSFAGDGKQTTHISSINTGDNYSTYEIANLIAIQKDGKIIIGGLSSHDLYLVRYNSDGSLDSTFNGDGLLKGPDYYIDEHQPDPFPAVLTIQNDGKIIAGGGGDKTIIRYNTDGSVDSTFSVTANYNTLSLAIQKDGKLVGAGNSIARYNIDGSVDKTFGKNGRRTTSFQSSSVAIQNDGKIVVVYNAYSFGYPDSTFYVNRYNSDGTTDSSFSQDGKQETKFNSGGTVQTVAIQPDGKIVAGGGRLEGYDNNFNKYPGYFALTRYSEDGSLDNTFDKDGKLIDSATYAGNSVYKHTVIQKDGKIAAAGSTWNGSEFVSAIVRYNTDGSLDSIFLNNTKQISSLTGDLLALQKDGKFIVAGGRSLTRINSDGTLDNTFNSNENQLEDINAIEIQKDGKIVSVSNNSVTRYNINGSLDKTFGENGIQTLNFIIPGDVFPVNFISSAIQSDGEIVLAGFRDDIAIARLNTNGSFDSTFDNDGFVVLKNYYNDESYADVYSCSIIIQGDDKIVVGSDLDYLGFWLVRVNSNGSIDSTFNETPVKEFTQQFGVSSSLALKSDGKILAGGAELIRYKTDGSVDSTFNIDAYQSIDFGINDIAISNNKLYAVGGGYLGEVARYMLDNNSNTSPTVSITNPVNNQTIAGPTTIHLKAVATDTDGTISKVEFYNDSALMHTETLIPYGYTWKHIPFGSYTVTAKAYDNSGNVTTSDTVHFTVAPNTPPAVTIISPADNSTYADTATIHLIASAADTDGRITRVEFYSGTTLIRTEYKSPYTYNWANVPAGIYTITAKATDNYGSHTTSAPITITVISSSAIVSSRPYSENKKTTLNDALSLRLSPNPASNIVNIYTFGLQQSKPATVSIISVSGIVLKTMRINNSATQLDISSLVSGVYTIKIVSGEKVMYKQFVKL